MQIQFINLLLALESNTFMVQQKSQSTLLLSLRCLPQFTHQTSLFGCLERERERESSYPPPAHTEGMHGSRTTPVEDLRSVWVEHNQRETELFLHLGVLALFFFLLGGRRLQGSRLLVGLPFLLCSFHEFRGNNA
jgi:hypothetical protein